MEKTQDYSSHMRWHKPYHFIFAPFMFIHLIFTVVRFVQYPDWDRGEYVLLAIALVAITLFARTNALKVQDRIIRLEENLRFKDVLSSDLAEAASKIRTSQIIALRFASDEELPELVEKVANGELTTQKEIKMAIRDWRADHFRV